MGLIADIIAAGLDGTTTQLLNKALVAASRLGDADMSDFATKELNGYDRSDLPEHRKLKSQLKARTPWTNWEDAIVPDDNMAFLLEARFGEGVAELEDLVTGATGGFVQVVPPPGQQEILRRIFQAASNVTFSQFVTKATVVQALQRTRSIVLDWALKLEASGIHGEGFEFSPKEKQVATHVTNTLINHGVMHHAQIQQGSSGKQNLETGQDLQALVALMSEVIANVAQLGASAAEAAADAQTVIAQVNSGRPKEGVVRASLESLRSILENAGGTLLAEKVLPRLLPYLPALGAMIAGIVG